MTTEDDKNLDFNIHGSHLSGTQPCSSVFLLLMTVCATEGRAKQLQARPNSLKHSQRVSCVYCSPLSVSLPLLGLQ